MNFTGTPSSDESAMAMPPLAVPSSFVMTSPVTFAISANSWAWEMAFCPVVPSRTRSVSRSASGYSRSRIR